ncbi:MAG TPA: hypothetical protein VKT72_11725 [Candidatus Baltobacteraceae bacterium]|nr:hypothetical protein [Candidatus Baltobacteraceae bacterium]
MIGALTLLGALLASTATGAQTLTGKMAIYDNLLGARWTCTLGKATYFAAYRSPGKHAARPSLLNGIFGRRVLRL